MSYITNIIVIVDIDDSDKLSEINKYFESIDKPGLSRAGENSGGDKVFCDTVFMGAFNHIDLEDFLNHLRKIRKSFESKSDLQVFAKEEDDEKYKIVL